MPAFKLALEIRADPAFMLPNSYSNLLYRIPQSDLYPNMEETDAQSDWGGLISGEIMQEESHACYLALPYLRMPVAGQLFFSSYRILFFPTKTDPSFDQFKVRQRPFSALSIAPACVSSRGMALFGYN